MEEKEMTRLMICLLLVLFIAAVFAADEDGKDPSTWTPSRIPGRQRAPELADITDWINSPPLKMSDLKGKVVVVHFMAFG
jgi:hypothetical protein